MSFYRNRVSAWRYNNPLENRLMRWFIWVTLRIQHSAHNSLHNTHLWHWECPYTSRKQAALFTYMRLRMRWMDGWQTCHYYLPPSHVTFLSCCSLKQRFYTSVTMTLLVRETAEDNKLCAAKPPAVWPLTVHILYTGYLVYQMSVTCNSYCVFEKRSVVYNQKVLCIV